MSKSDLDVISTPPERAETGIDTGSPMVAMIELARQLGPEGRETLAQLADMQREQQDRQARQQWATAMSAFQAEAPTITPNRKGAHGAPYADRAHIMQTIQPLLSRHGLSITFGAPGPEERDGEGFAVVCIVHHVGGHNERTPFSVPREKPGNRMNVSQAEGSASEYAQRYALKLALNLRVGDVDDDGHAAGAREVELVTPHQATELRALAEDIGLEPADVFRDAQGYLGVLIDSWAAIPADKYHGMIRAMQARRK